MIAVQADFWKSCPTDSSPSRMPAGSVQCLLCPHSCRIAPSHSGSCGVRHNYNGKLYSVSSPNISSAHADPIEKKPLYHFHPGSISFSIGTPGCNLHCSFCQNHSLSQPRPTPATRLLDTIPQQLPDSVIQSALTAGAQSIAYTYSEPTIFYELVKACAPRANEHGIANILVSNGFTSPEVLLSLLPHIQAANFDLKSIHDEFYRNYCSARLKPVLSTIERALRAGVWVELTTLLIPGCNDSPEELEQIAEYIQKEFGAQVPWHISRFRPCYKMTDTPATPLETIFKAQEAGKAAGLHHVYPGNVPPNLESDTRCPRCGEIFIKRYGYQTTLAVGSSCAACKTPIAGVWK